ncbi:MAG: phasin family protein [Candidatus Dactylopiibacterium sp.]|nr:phasin family protein [Candidatus Dactylopiibacterium sp.]
MSFSDQFTGANKASIEAALTFANSAFASAEKLATLNLNTARNLLEDSVSHTKNLLAAKDVQEFVSLQSAAVQPALEKFVSYGRGVYEIAAAAQEDLSRVVESQVSETSKNVSAVLDKAARSAPAGSDVAVAAVKSALAAANTAYDSINKAARQVAELTEANVSAATQATVKAVGGAATRAKKVA